MPGKDFDVTVREGEITIDEDGRVVIANPELAERLREQGPGKYELDVAGNGNCGCSFKEA